MAGYYRYSMSLNAIEAYENGEKPISRWSKGDILCAINERIRDGKIKLACDFNMFAKIPATELKKRALYMTSWHHTGSHYNRTKFYSINYNFVVNITDDQINDIIQEYRASKKELVEEE